MIINNYYNCCCQHVWRIIFEIGLFSKTNNPVEKTPQYHKKIEGAYDVLTNMTVDQQFRLTIKSFKDSHGNVATVDGVPTWATDNTDILALTPSADGMTCEIRAVGMVGGANVQVTADADLGPNVKTIIGTHMVEVSAGEAQVIELEASTPENQ